MPMSHSLTKIWLHVVFGTKNGEPLIHPTIEQHIHQHLRDQLENDFQCQVRTINGMPNHIHILFQLNVNFAVKDIIKNIKGESSHWINQEGFMRGKFAWQTGYGVFSVSESIVNRVESYIRNQKEHHRKQSFADEYDKFMKKHGVVISSQKDENG
jgi:REP element-mobilizing transposase RayT